MYQTYRDRVAFLFVYIREAHPADEWPMPANERDSLVFKQPASLVERSARAAQCCQGLAITMPAVVDAMDNRVDAVYAAWPERLYVIDAQGRIAYAGRRGPWGFKPEEVERWLERHVR